MSCSSSTRNQPPGWPFEREFAQATTRSQQPRLRWWWPGAAVTDGEVRRELAEIAAAGFGGVEIADVYDSVHARIDPSTLGWGTARWNAAVAVALGAAAEHGLKVDLTIGPHWPAALPTVAPGDAAAAQELVYGQARVEATQTFDGPLPKPAFAPSGVTEGNPSPPGTARLLCVLAARCVGACRTDGTVTLEARSVVDLSAAVVDGRLAWRAPAGGDWLVLPVYTRPTGQIVNMFDDSPRNSPMTEPQSYVVDPFGEAGTQAIIKYWNEALLTPAVRQGLARAGGAIFEDSLELKAAQHWTAGMLEAFEARRGYSVVPYLPVLIDRKPKTFTQPAEPAFAFDDATLTQRVRADWNQTLAELWQRNHLEPLRDWAKSLGLIFRSQSYGGPVDTILAAATTGQPEGESLGFGKQLDKFRALRAGLDLGGGNLLSDEMGAFYGAYDTPWTTKMLPAINRNFAAGVNQLYLHGYAYADAPGAPWPGFAPFGTLFAEPWNAMQPSWRHVGDLSGYLTRVQAVLQHGRNRTDLAVLRLPLDLDGGYLSDESLLDRGYTVGYLSPATLKLPTAVVSDGVLDSGGPAFRALVLLDVAAVPPDALRRIVSLARAGLPVVGPLSGESSLLPSGSSGNTQAEQLVSELLAAPRVLRAAAEGELYGVLVAAGLAPAVAYERAAKLRHVHRQADDADLYYLVNDGDAAETLRVALPGRGTPWQLDPWTGAVSRVALYEQREGSVEISLSLGPGQSALFVLRPSGVAAEKTSAHAATTTGGVVVAARDGLALRVFEAGRHTVTLADGTEALIAAAPLPPALTISGWRLRVQSWEPGDSATQTRLRDLPEVALPSLVPWTSIDGLEDVSGVGTYTAKVTLGADWSAGIGAELRLGTHSDTIRIRVSGLALGPVDQLADRVDLGHALKVGDNVVEIEVATTLNNVLLATQPSAFEVSYTGPRSRAEYGLLGPVSLEPYRQLPIGAQGER